MNISNTGIANKSKYQGEKTNPRVTPIQVSSGPMKIGTVQQATHAAAVAPSNPNAFKNFFIVSSGLVYLLKSAC